MVASVSGTYNEVLTMTTADMTTNDYKYYVVFYPDKLMYYTIASNTANTITLNTPTTAYFNMANKVILVKKPSDYFGCNESGVFPEINSALNINATDSMTNEISADDLRLILPKIEDYIHDFLERTSCFTYSDKGFAIVQHVILSMIQRWNRRRQYNKATNQLQLTPESYIPDITPQEESKLLKINLPDSDVCYIADSYATYGKRIYPNENSWSW